MLQFGVRETFGLTDESYGLERAQHPYVYTHGGNFPRLYTLLLLVLGARTAEAQIVITTFTVGLMGLLFAYHFFSRVATPLFALTYCLVFMSDFAMQTQWLVNTWRAWHHFFVFSSLLCVHGLARRKSVRPWLAAVTLLNFACLIYLEIVFAAFVTVLAAVYAGLIGRRRPFRVLRNWSLIAGGAALGGAVLAGQLIGYLGWNGFREDVRLTFLARNTAAADLNAFRSEVWAFVEEHHLVFWDNFLGGIGGYSAVIRWCLQAYTPALVFVALLISSAWALSFLPVFEVVVVSKGRRRIWSMRNATPWAIVAATLFACATLMDTAFAGVIDGDRRVRALVAGMVGLAVGGLGVAVCRRLRERNRELPGLPASKVVLCAVLLLIFAALARHHPTLYNDTGSGALFREMIAKTGGSVVWRLAVLAAAAMAVSLVFAPGAVIGREGRSFKRLLLFVVAGVAALMVVVRLFPGYVVSGYLLRYCPLTVCVQLVPLAAVFYVLAGASVRSLGALAASRSMRLTRILHTSVDSESRTTVGQVILSVCAVLLLCLLSGYWLMLQAAWIARHDPQATLLKELQRPEYRGASFAVNTYAAPVAFLAKGWAYFDPQMGQSELRNFDGRFYLRRDFRYLWLADKRSNARYFEPGYYVCWLHRELLDPVEGGARCQDFLIVAEARRGTSLLGHREVARDESGRDAWSIIKLNWTYPPGSGRRIVWDDRQYRRTLALPW
jgi:hypothetical protein